MNFKKILFGDGRLKELRWWDILVATAIMIGPFIYSSTVNYLSALNSAAQTGASTNIINNNFDSMNYDMLLFQLPLLVATLVYLRIRNFDFSKWKFKINWKTILYGIGLFILISLVVDIIYLVGSNIALYLGDSMEMVNAAGVDAESAMEQTESGTLADMILGKLNISTIIYALFNGVYEELYFLGMCLFVAPKYVKWSFLFSILVRFSFHTYQGILPAIGITSIGVVYYIIYMKTKKKNLYPFFLSHEIADVFGLSILGYFML